MKKNFYLQHSLMSMFDPGMKQLVSNEGLKGVGAYWVIIEKLSVLPEPRAQLDYLRVFCGKKISLRYLKKIIWEYDLFELEEDGYFTPKELNSPRKKEEKATSEKPDSQTRKEGKAAETTSEKPDFQAKKEGKTTPEKPDSSRKNDEKTAKNAPEKPDSQAKNDEKQQKMSGNKSENRPEISSNTLNYSHLRENSTKFDKNTTIYINITTASSTEEKEEAAAEDALSSPKTTPVPARAAPSPTEMPHSGRQNATPQRPKCHTSTPEMPHLSVRNAPQRPETPHLNVPNATPQRPEYASTSQMPRLNTTNTHLNVRNATLQRPECTSTPRNAIPQRSEMPHLSVRNAPQRPKRHTSASEMPHLNARNATPKRPKCHT